jgi:hypothetical protein
MYVNTDFAGKIMEREEKGQKDVIPPHSLPRVDQPRVVFCSPAEIPHPLYVGRIFIELFHRLPRQTLKCLAIAAAIREELKESEDGWEVCRSEGKKVRRKGGSMVWCRDRCKTENAEIAVS